MAGRFMDEMPGMSFGHAGTIVEGKEDTATEKIARLATPGSWSPSGSRTSPDRQGEGGGLMAGTVHRRRGRRRRSPATPSSPRKLAEVCPVDIFSAGEDGVEIVEDNLDECVLCELCINAAPPGAVTIAQAVLGRDAAPPCVAGRAQRVGTD